MTLFIYKANCSTCREGKKMLDAKGVAYQARDLNKNPLTPKELTELVGEKDIQPFINTRTALYREKNMKTSLPPRKQIIAWMAQHPNLIKRPLLVHNGEFTHGLDRSYYASL
jgi:arsenate reductase